MTKQTGKKNKKMFSMGGSAVVAVEGVPVWVTEQRAFMLAERGRTARMTYAVAPDGTLVLGEPTGEGAEELGERLIEFAFGEIARRDMKAEASAAPRLQSYLELHPLWLPFIDYKNV